MLRLLFDECVSASLADIARELGHDVSRVAEVARSSPDETVFSIAMREKRVLVTEDKGFGRMAVSAGFVPQGLVLLRLPKWDLALKQKRFRELLLASSDRLQGSLTVVGRNAIRHRPLGD